MVYWPYNYMGITTGQPRTQARVSILEPVRAGSRARAGIAALLV